MVAPYLTEDPPCFLPRWLYQFNFYQQCAVASPHLTMILISISRILRDTLCIFSYDSSPLVCWPLKNILFTSIVHYSIEIFAVTGLLFVFTIQLHCSKMRFVISYDVYSLEISFPIPHIFSSFCRWLTLYLWFSLVKII